MLYDYIATNYQKDEPIFLAELPGKSRESIRQEMKKLTDEGKMERLYNGVYYRWLNSFRKRVIHIVRLWKYGECWGGVDLRQQ